jgi:hypothetical protein
MGIHNKLNKGILDYTVRINKLLTLHGARNRKKEYKKTLETLVWIVHVSVNMGR